MRFMTSLKFIDVVAREGSIRKAADKLAITSTALNRRILRSRMRSDSRCSRGFPAACG